MPLEVREIDGIGTGQGTRIGYRIRSARAKIEHANRPRPYEVGGASMLLLLPDQRAGTVIVSVRSPRLLFTSSETVPVLVTAPSWVAPVLMSPSVIAPGVTPDPNGEDGAHQAFFDEVLPTADKFEDFHERDVTSINAFLIRARGGAPALP